MTNSIIKLIGYNEIPYFKYFNWAFCALSFCFISFNLLIFIFGAILTQTEQDLSPDRIARLILHILFLEKSKSVTLILT